VLVKHFGHGFHGHVVQVGLIVHGVLQEQLVQVWFLLFDLDFFFGNGLFGNFDIDRGGLNPFRQ
jgi:hypothetical protein